MAAEEATAGGAGTTDAGTTDAGATDAGTTEHAAAGYLERTLALLWDTGERPARGPKPGLTRDRVVEAAIRVADTDGVAALSMRRVANELGVGTMSLYRYVPGKTELLDLMLDRVSAPGDDEEKLRGLGWREALEAIARGAYRLYLAHPWLLQVNWCRPVFGPNTLVGLELHFASTDGIGLTSQERVSVLIMIDSLVTGLARSQVLYASAAEETGVSDDEFWAAHYPVLEQAMATGKYPAMAALDEHAFDAGWEETFAFGLARLLDGLAAMVEVRSQRQGQRDN